jgi:hypothetical protein
VDFIGVDGEGVTTGDAHQYILLTCGDATVHLDGARLTTLDIFDFLWAQSLEHPGAAFVGFYLGYDFAQWLRDIPESRARKLLTEDGIKSRIRRTEEGKRLAPWPVDWGEWQFDMLHGRRFKLRRETPARMEYRGNHDGRSPTREAVAADPSLEAMPWMTICDTGPFFQSSFLKAIDPSSWRVPIVTAQEFETIKAGKAGRGTDEFGPDMIRYNVLECDVLARLMRNQNEALTGEGVRLNKTQWIGPGQVAQKWLRSIDAPKGEAVRELVPDWFREAARAAYFGGWFEIFWHGPYRGASWSYDINSAYPDTMSRLPCLLHGAFSRGRIMRATHDAGAHAKSLTLVEATVKGSHPIVGAMMHRRPNGWVLRPRETAGWFWLHELQAAQAAGFVDMFHVKQWRRFTPRCDCPPPLAPIARLYESRLAVGKNSPAGKAKKLIYNSGYGKFAQSVGEPVYANPVYASLITAGCRVRILEAIRSHPTQAASLLMVATDGVVFGERHDALDLDDARLGAWSEGEHRNLSLFMPGVYWDDASRSGIRAADLKSRGISARDLADRIGLIDAAWPRYRRDGWPKMVLPVEFQLVSPKQALARGKWEICGSVITDGQRLINADPSPKRVGSGPGRSRPYGACPELVSAPYDGSFGEELREAADEEFGDHPDGPIGSVLMREIWGR